MRGLASPSCRHVPGKLSMLSSCAHATIHVVVMCLCEEPYKHTRFGLLPKARCACAVMQPSCVTPPAPNARRPSVRAPWWWCPGVTRRPGSGGGPRGRTSTRTSTSTHVAIPFLLVVPCAAIRPFAASRRVAAFRPSHCLSSFSPPFGLFAAFRLPRAAASSFHGMVPWAA